MAQRSSISKSDIEVADQKHSHLENGAEAIEIGGFRVFGLDPDDADFYNSYTEEQRKKVFRKVDVRLVPMLALLYLICHIDRANIGNAKIEGMVEDLGMTGVQYNTILSICMFHSRRQLDGAVLTLEQSLSPTSFSKSLVIFC
jgi:hypothetical protein